jgi:isoleucyl-tRNA synthetase
VVRVVQQARREADLAVTDRIGLLVSASADVEAAVAAHRSFVESETLATSVRFGDVPGDGFKGEVGEGEQVAVVVTRV